MKNLSSPPSSVSSFDIKPQNVRQESCGKTTSPTTFGSDHDTLETTLSLRGSERSEEESGYKRSRSFHGKGGKKFIKKKKSRWNKISMLLYGGYPIISCQKSIAVSLSLFTSLSLSLSYLLSSSFHFCIIHSIAV
jgi:hypothetical protein